jgi:hypothetical protein
LLGQIEYGFAMFERNDDAGVFESALVSRGLKKSHQLGPEDDVVLLVTQRAIHAVHVRHYAVTFSEFFTARSRLCRWRAVTVLEKDRNMQRQDWTGIVACLAAAWVILGARPAFGQPNVSRSAPTVGATVGIVGVGSSWSGGGEGLVVNGHLDLPAVPSWRVRLAAGTLRWRPTNEALGGEPRTDRARLTHVTATAIRSYIEPSLRYPVGLYGGLGIGSYSYRIQRGPFTNPRSFGIHAVGGIEYQKFGRDVGVRLEVQFHATGGPGHAQVWATTVPMISAALGISRSF